uniref:Uncharacterized protein n=1 Tax=Anguilla anguilla TaxID=7936 RepID=A0A0E9WWA2_ANGAN
MKISGKFFSTLGLLVGQDFLYDLFDPGSGGVQTDLLTSPFQSGNDLRVLAVGTGREELHTLDEFRHSSALRLDTATPQIHPYSPHTHSFSAESGQEDQAYGSCDCALHNSLS